MIAWRLGLPQDSAPRLEALFVLGEAGESPSLQVSRGPQRTVQAGDDLAISIATIDALAAAIRVAQPHLGRRVPTAA